MKLVNWVRFSWDLTKLPPLDCKLPEHYEIAPASREDEAELRKVISRSIVLDATWNPAMQEVMQTINTWLDEAFASPTSIFLALRHGTRIIGASILSPDSSGQNHLHAGPVRSRRVSKSRIRNGPAQTFIASLARGRRDTSNRGIQGKRAGRKIPLPEV